MEDCTDLCQRLNWPALKKGISFKRFLNRCYIGKQLENTIQLNKGKKLCVLDLGELQLTIRRSNNKLRVLRNVTLAPRTK